MAEPREQQIQDHGRALERLRPPGLAWTTEAGSVSRQLFDALATELARVTGRAATLIGEADPRTTVELIADWERILGLPGPCEELGPTLILRQFAVTAKLASPQGQSRQHFIDLASGLGFNIEIEEYTPFESGRSVSGDAITNGDWVFTWTTHHPEFGGQFAAAGVAQAGEALLELNDATLKCFLAEAKPAHTQLLFSGDLPWSGYAPWTTIAPDPAVLIPSNPTAFVQEA